MKQLLIFISVLFIIGCNKTEVVSPTPPTTQANNNQNVNPPIMSDYRQYTFTVIDETGDTIYSSLNNDGLEDKVALVREKFTSNQDLMFMRTMKEPKYFLPVTFSFAYIENDTVTAQETQCFGSERAFKNHLDIMCKIMDLSGDVWISSADEGLETSNEITEYTSYGRQSVEILTQNQSKGFISDYETVTDTFTVYQVFGTIDGTFYKQGSNSETTTFTVNYALPLFL